MAPVRAGLNRIPPVAGAILAGGASRRFGAEKALAPAPEHPMAETVLRALRDANLDPVVLIGASPAVSGRLGIPSVPDRLPGEGPLAGLGTALGWASGVTRVVVVPCDLPRLVAPVVRSLVAAGDNATAAVARLDGSPHPILGCWPTAFAAPLNTILRAGERRMIAALDVGPYVEVELDRQAILDADDPDTLAALVRRVDHDPDRQTG